MRSIFVTLVAVQLACAGANATSDEQARPAAAATPATPAEAVAADPLSGAGIKAFQDRVAAYIALRSKVDDGIPKLTETSDPKKIAERERALGEALIKARTGVKPGEIFVAEFQPIMRKIVKEDFAKRTLAERKALIIELPKGMKIVPNQVYPTTIPLATCPPNLLKALPDLPADIEYRIVYRHLILRDVKANYVIDIAQDVFPIPV